MYGETCVNCVDLEDLLAGDDTAQRAVGDLQHLLDDADRTDALNVVGLGILDLAVLEDRQADRLAFAQRLFDELNARLLDDRERNDGVREEHRFLERQDADQVGGCDRRVLLRGHSSRNESSLPKCGVRCGPSGDTRWRQSGVR